MTSERWVTHASLVFAAVYLFSASIAAQSSQISDFEALSELRRIREALERLAQEKPSDKSPERPTMARVTTTGEALGRTDAPLTIVEFVDLQCPFCKQFAGTTFQYLKSNYIDQGLVRFVVKDLPLAELHPTAELAAHARRCAGEQSRQWDMQRLILESSSAFSLADAETFAAHLGLRTAPFRLCMTDRQRFAHAIAADVKEATAAGITATPTFVIGRTAPSMEGVRIVGSQPQRAFDDAVAALTADAIPAKFQSPSPNR